jgi:hypothetical protein
MTPITTTAPTAQPDLSTLPRRVDRKTGAEMVTLYFFPVTSRTLELWPVAWCMVRGRAVCETAALFTVAQAKLDAAPPIRSIRRRMPAAAADLQPAE